MYKPVFAALALAVAFAAPSLAPMASADTPASPPAAGFSVLASPPPVIAHVVSRAVCSALRRRIAPTVAMMAQNDAVISKSPPLFSRYNTEVGSSTVDANGEDADDNAGKNMILMHMEQLVPTLAQNTIKIRQLLQDPNYIPPSVKGTSDEQLMNTMRDDLLNAVASQELSLDIVNGFVTTQQLGDMQHEGFGFVEQQSKPEATPTPSLPAPFGQASDPNAAGLPANPYEIDPAAVPGLSVGYNPVTRLLDALQWSRKEATTREAAAIPAILKAVALCGGNVNATPPPASAPSPKPSR